MDHNLEDALNLETDMGSMDFDHSRPVVSQEDISLETSHEGDIPMEFEQIEEQPMLMDTGNEEIIVSDFMSDQYTLQEYSIQGDQTAENKGNDDPSDILSSQSESMIDLNFEPATVSQTFASDATSAPKIITVKAPTATRTIKRPEIATMPKQVAIAPKPPNLVATTQKLVSTPRTYSKQLAIAPKPVTLVVNKNASLKKTTVSGVIQGTVKNNAVLTQIGKQLLMMPAGGGQKIKLVSGSGPLQYAQITKKVAGTNPPKPGLTQVILRRDNQSDQPAVITKIAPSTTSANSTKYVMQQKTVPISIAGSKVILSPTKAPMKIAKKQIIAIKSPTPKLMPATSQANVGTKKVVITPNSSQNVILKTTAPPKSAQVLKDGNVVVQAQRSQLHQINVPGKGIQYIRLITNSSPAPQKVGGKTQAPPLAITSKNFVLADSKGNIIQMNTENVGNSQPPPLVITSSIGANAGQVAGKAQKKLVRIAPSSSKTAQLVMHQSTRPLQSLLAPFSHEDQSTKVQLEETQMEAQIKIEAHSEDVEAEEEEEIEEQEEQNDSKASLRMLLDQSAEGNMAGISMQEVEVNYEGQDTDTEDSNSNEHENEQKPEEHSLIVIPSTFQVKQENQIRVTSENSKNLNESNYSNLETEVMVPYLSPRDNLTIPGDDVTNEMGMKPRKACNCTKSQCLRLYCDCFANGEFCNSCNCINCHNNLDNEEIRQKAIRACLDRNPNAFRPKIGKYKSGGPDVVRRHNKGCHCKRSGCLKNYCECYEAKIACTAVCKCVGCRNVEETIDRRRDALRLRESRQETVRRPPVVPVAFKQPCSFMTSEVIEAVCQCLVAAAADSGAESPAQVEPDPVRDVIEEFARCLQDIIGASHLSGALSPIHQGQA